jgi:flagellar hook assembly protein FlgD
MIRTLNDRVLDAGPHVLAWDGRDERGVSTPPGVYMIRVRDVGRDLVAAKVVMLR